MDILHNLKKVNKVNNIETYKANIDIIVKKIEAKDESDTAFYMEKLLYNKNTKKIYDIKKENNNIIYVYLDPNENIDDILYPNTEEEIKQSYKGGPPALTKTNLEEIFEQEKAICKIKFQNKKNKCFETCFGSGFFVNLNQEGFPFTNCLITNNHVLDEQKISINKDIDIFYKNKLKKIKISSKRRRYTNKELDYTCIEIFEEDGIDNFFDIDQRILENDPKLYIGENIYSLHYPQGGELSFSMGVIETISKTKIGHNCSTESGSSGSPIISQYNSSVVGLHYGSSRKYKYNVSITISSIINDIKMKINNYIIAEIEIKKDDINKDVKILNSFEQRKLENKINKKEKYLNYENEKEIKENCIIEINNEVIPFNYFHKFREEGLYLIKYSFLNNLTNSNSMFYDCEFFKTIDLSHFRTENITNMSYMICNCFNLKSIIISNYLENFDTSNVTDMKCMFCGCNSLIELDLSNLNTEKVTNMAYMFGYCTSLSELDLTSFNTKKVINMSYMFYTCQSLKKLDIKSFNTENVTDMDSMFCGCNSLRKIDLSSFNTENVINMCNLFGVCTSLQEVRLSNFITKNVTNMAYMFSGCEKLDYADLSNFTTEKVTMIGGMFMSCNCLISINLKANDKKILDEYNICSSNKY